MVVHGGSGIYLPMQLLVGIDLIYEGITTATYVSGRFSRFADVVGIDLIYEGITTRPL